MSPVRLLLAGLLLGAALVCAQDQAGSAAAASAPCLDCHDFGPDSPVHAVLAGSHGLSGDDEAMAGRRGCPDCHGASTAHADAPTTIAPDVSFGPRWTATAGAQDAQCLACHEQDTASNWRHSLHMLNNLTCVTCHDLLTWEDEVLVADKQAKVCTTCHKAQKRGIHGIQALASDNPPCSACHNPHDHESAETEMLHNDSAGCRTCHDLAGTQAPEAAADYHRIAQRGDHTCLDCHRGIAHAPADAVTAMLAEPLSSRQVALFYPGGADSEWLQREHPGSQPLRQGRNCQQCHRGEEARMGAVQASGQITPSRTMRVSFARTADDLVMTLSWEGSDEDRMLAVMWGDDDSEAFRRGGCFAACHSDLPGMRRDSGVQTQKYLAVSRGERALPGQATTVLSPADLEELVAAGEFVSLWQLQLDSGKLAVATLLAGLEPEPANLIQINKSHSEGRWKVELRAPLNNTVIKKPFITDEKYTFGIALGGADNPGGKHWVSLPFSLSFAGDETDFKVEQQ